MGETELETHKRDEWTEKFVRLLEQKRFSEIRADYPSSPYNAPKSIYGYKTAITAHDSHNRFCIIEVEMGDLSDPAVQQRLSAFGKYATLHKSAYWIIYSKDYEAKLPKVLKDLKLTEVVKFTKGV